MANRQSGRNEIERLDREYTLGTWTRQRDFDPTQIVDTNGPRIVTADGDSILDFSSQYVCTSLGYDAERVSDAVAEQIRTVPYVNPGWATEPRARLSEKLAEITPGPLKKTFYSTSGTEANEAAFKIARAYTGKHKILSRYRSYHGATAASLSASGDPRRVAQGPEIQPEVPGMVKGPDPYAYGSSLDPDESLEYIDEMLKLEGGTVAAVLVEPLVGSNGVLTPPDDYLPRLQEIAHDHGALLICDEVMTGFGRTGEWFASALYDAEPDIITMAKGLTGSYQPLAATTVTEEIAEYFEDTLLNQGHTFAGHPTACAAGVAAIETYEEEGLVENAREMGQYLKSKLDSLAERHPSVGERRGVGLHQGLELTKSTDERVPFEQREDKVSSTTTVLDEVGARALDNGVYFYTSVNTIVVTPPLTITRDEVDEAVDALDDALRLSDAAMDE
ncbi:aspartate aminotransferase family protein [Haloplanus rubicundus]|uniref:Aspartate aminotransferase family protein n=1 Tax=Haloplanus rubicundus TaxID=1547898 RepID=A0A345E2C9_9EURY|nr:aspartate aminotransferase family protein [Haloplanus rubicundus]AXG06351.1 aspartate aminotransferase family protein [Haloplanus rubicundus]